MNQKKHCKIPGTPESAPLKRRAKNSILMCEFKGLEDSELEILARNKLTESLGREHSYSVGTDKHQVSLKWLHMENGPGTLYSMYSCYAPYNDYGVEQWVRVYMEEEGKEIIASCPQSSGKPWTLVLTAMRPLRTTIVKDSYGTLR